MRLNEAQRNELAKLTKWNYFTLLIALLYAGLIFTNYFL
jgi:hypothetical protein